MPRWVGFIDLLALRHAASIDQSAVERLLSCFFEVLTTFADDYTADELSVDVLSDSAVLRFAEFGVLSSFYLKIRPEMLLREAYFRLGVSYGDVEIKRFPQPGETYRNVAGTYFQGAAGMAAYAAQNNLNGAGAILLRPGSSSALGGSEDHNQEFNDALRTGKVIRTIFFGRSPRPEVHSYYDFSMTSAELGSLFSREEGQTLGQAMGDEDENSGFIFFDEIYSKYAYTKGLNRFIARKYVNIFTNIVNSHDFGKTHISPDGEEFSGLAPFLCRMFFDDRFRGMDRDEDFAFVMLGALGRLVEEKCAGLKGRAGIKQALDRVPELQWTCSVLRKRRQLFKRIGSVSPELVSMKAKDLILRGMTELGYVY
jgi:hypothetical protein